MQHLTGCGRNGKTRSACLLRVKLRRTQCEQMSSGLTDGNQAAKKPPLAGERASSAILGRAVEHGYGPIGPVAALLSLLSVASDR